MTGEANHVVYIFYQAKSPDFSGSRVSGKFLLHTEDEAEQNLYRSFPRSRSNAKNLFDVIKCTLHCHAGGRLYHTGTITTTSVSTQYL